jgi:hypothetical protein
VEGVRGRKFWISIIKKGEGGILQILTIADGGEGFFAVPRFCPVHFQSGIATFLMSA